MSGEKRGLTPLLVSVLLLTGSGMALGAPGKARAYYVYVTCESEDEVAVVRLRVPESGDGEPALDVVKKITVGVLELEMEGPHGITVSPDGRHWYLSMAHGKPFGRVYKYSTGDDRKLGHVELWLFPATMAVSRATGLLHVVNFNLHGDPVRSSVSVVDPQKMVEVARVRTGVMPHGSRFSPDGLRHYSVGMMSHELYEIDAVSFQVARRLKLAPSATGRKTKPTWVQVHPTKPLVYVACNGSDEVAEVDLKEWKIRRRFATAPGPYNVEVTPDGAKLVVTYKSDSSTGIWDLEKGKELARVPSTRKVSHGIAITPDSRYALVTSEGKGAESGAVDAIDLRTFQRLGAAHVGKQAAGIAFWKMEELPE
ncbi:MAG: YncE family protein [Planctomycetota bacterium]|nr:YncE family protein [Planctomycetota bacterium]